MAFACSGAKVEGGTAPRVPLLSCARRSRQRLSMLVDEDVPSSCQKFGFVQASPGVAGQANGWHWHVPSY